MTNDECTTEPHHAIIHVLQMMIFRALVCYKFVVVATLSKLIYFPLMWTKGFEV